MVELEAGIEGEYQNGSSLSQGLMLVILIWWMDGGAVLSLRKSVTSTDQKKKNDDCSLPNERYNCTGE